MQNNFINADDIPLGFGMLLAQNQQAMERFASLSPAQKQSVLKGARTVSSKAEMRDYVDKIGTALTDEPGSLS